MIVDRTSDSIINGISQVDKFYRFVAHWNVFRNDKLFLRPAAKDKENELNLRSDRYSDDAFDLIKAASVKCSFKYFL